MKNRKVLGAGLACIDIIGQRENGDVSLEGTAANVMTVLAQMGFEVNILTAEYTGDIGNWYNEALNTRRIFPIYFQTSKKQMPIVFEEIKENGKGHSFITICPYCSHSLMNVILPTQERINKVLKNEPQFNIVFLIGFPPGLGPRQRKNVKHG